MPSFAHANVDTYHFYSPGTPTVVKPRKKQWGTTPRRRKRRDFDAVKIFAFIRRCLRTGFCSPDLADFSNLYSSSDDKLFKKILTRPDHILRTLLPPPTEQNYNLRNRPHNRQLPDRISKITDCNFIVRMFYSNMY